MKTHLTPAEVRYFERNGVDFGQTKDVWYCEKGKDVAFRRFERLANPDNYPVQQMATETMEHVAAPTMAEVITKLPARFFEGGGCICLIMDYVVNGVYYYNTTKGLYPLDSRVTPAFDLTDPLKGVANLFRWIIENKPTTLNK